MTDHNPDDQTPNAVVATYTNDDDVTTAVKHLERKGFDMSKISVLGKGLSEERHIVGIRVLPDDQPASIRRPWRLSVRRRPLDPDASWAERGTASQAAWAAMGVTKVTDLLDIR